MSETGEMPPGVEVEKNPVVEAARKAVRGGLETNEAWRKYRDTLNVKTEGKSVYRAWVDAADKVVGAMTKADQEKFSTKLYQVKMRVLAAALQIPSAVIDTTFNVLSWIPRKGLMLAGMLTSPIPFVGGTLFATGVALEGITRVGTRGLITPFAEPHANRRILRYKIAEARLAAKAGGDFIGNSVKQIVTGFAYPEGKPVKPPMAKI